MLRAVITFFFSLLVAGISQADEKIAPLDLSLPKRSTYDLKGYTEIYAQPRRDVFGEVLSKDPERECWRFAVYVPFAKTEHHGTTRKSYNETHALWGFKWYYPTRFLRACWGAGASYMEKNSNNGEMSEFHGGPMWNIIGNQDAGIHFGLTAAYIIRYEHPNRGSISGGVPGVAPTLTLNYKRFFVEVVRPRFGDNAVDMIRFGFVF